MVAPLVPIAIAAAGGFALYEFVFKKKKLPVLQSLRTTSPTGQQVQVVVPVANQPKPVAGVSATPLHPNNTGTGASYAPAPVVQKVQGSTYTLAPMVITPTGAATLSITTVQDVQNGLNTLGYKGADGQALKVDGIAGPNTAFAVRAFETKNGLTVDAGIIGPQVKGAMQTALAALAGTNSDTGQQATTLAASGDPPSHVGFGGRWTAGLSGEFGRGHRRRKKKQQSSQSDGGDGGNGGNGDGASAGFGIGVIIPSQYPHLDYADESDYGGEFGSPRMRGLNAGPQREFVRPAFTRIDPHIPHPFNMPTEDSGCNISSITGIQHALNLLGASPPLVESGIYDSNTMAAVKAFQIAHGLVVDGTPNKTFRWALCLALNPNMVQPEPEPDDAQVSGELRCRTPGFG